MARAGITAERLTGAAADLADEIGFDNVTVSGLARRFGVADASLYSHVRNLRELRTRVAVRAARDFADVLAPAVAGRSGRAALAAFADAYRGFALAHPGRYAATNLQLPPEVVADSPGHLQLIEYTAAMLRGFPLAEPDRTDAVRLLRSTFHGFVAIEAANGFGHPREVATSWRRAIGALGHLLEHWPGADETEGTRP
ncbi:TetR/AcrR family transcriptional regulator [Plantactinospora siamensis]|uniref:TetR/AcrR family transcriptional regulator n=1 Tax=Plantactinospora siamensis TaxID=555372 RepID=A0ABV6P6A3_9ACTN